MENKTVIITGVSGNLGQAVLQLFLAKNYTVIGTVNHHDTTAAATENPRLEKVAVDLTNAADTEKFMQQVIAKHKTIDAVILTVGGFAMGNVAQTQTADVYQQYKLNFETAYNVARPAFEQMMKQQQGRIFMVGSKPGLDASKGKGMVAYSLSKSLIFKLAEILNHEAKGHNVVTSVIVPSTIDTPQNRKAMPDSNFDAWVKPEAIAQTIYFYCSPEAAALREPVIKLYNNS
ncbi:MAG: SDR family NAD(P)-dependent oxidoreductase [Bacteroidota bacterium]